MKKYIKLALPIFIGLLASCSAEEDLQGTGGSENPENGKKMTFTANIDTDVTRTHFDTDQKTVWSSEDKIWICNPATENANNTLPFTLTSEGNSKTGTFEAAQDIATSTTLANHFYAVYPCNNDVTITRKDNSTVTVSATIPAEQTAEETLSTRYQYLTAYTTGSSLSFKNVVSYFKVTVKSSDDFKISRIKIVANNLISEDGTSNVTYSKKYLNIAGTFTSAINTEGRTTIANGDITNGSSFVATTISNPDNAEHTYYLAVLPTAETLDFTLLLESEFKDGTQRIYQATKTGLTFAPGKVYDLGTFNATTLDSQKKVFDDVVDFDLPSGTIWATKNVGAMNPTDLGDYYQWGRITSYNSGTASQSFQTGHTYSGNTAPVVLGCDDDIAYLAYPSTDSPFKNKYSMPTKDQAKEFTQGGYIYAVKNTGDTYFTVYSKADYDSNTDKSKCRYIVMPIGGRKTGRSTFDNPTRASYWSTKRDGNNAHWYDFRDDTGHGYTSPYGNVTDGQGYGRLIRAVVINKNIAPVKTYDQLKSGQ